MATPPDLSALHTVLEQTIGYQLIGSFVSFILYGITVLQTNLYFSKFHNKDTKRMQAIVGFLWVIDTSCSVLVGYSLYSLLVKGWGDVSALVMPPYAFTVENGLSVLLTWIVHLFLAHRIWLVSRRRDFVMPVVVVVLSLVAFGAGITLTARIFAAHLTVSEVETDRIIGTTLILDQGSAAIADIIMTITLCFHLKQSKRNESGFERTDNVIDTLMSYFINRGALTSTVQVLYLATYLGLKSQQNWMLWHLMISKVYINSLLAILNVRTSVEKKLNGRTIMFNVPSMRLNGVEDSLGRNSPDAESEKLGDLGRTGFNSDIEFKNVAA